VALGGTFGSSARARRAALPLAHQAQIVLYVAVARVAMYIGVAKSGSPMAAQEPD